MSDTLATTSRVHDFSSAESGVDSVARAAVAAMAPDGPVVVKAVHPGNGIVGTVDVQPMVHQQDGEGTPTPHTIIYGVPYLRIQGGTSAIIIDPAVGDIGYVAISGRDISNVVSTRAPAPPGSFRVKDMADAVYVGAMLNASPAQYIQFTANGITVVSPSEVTIQAPTIQMTGTVKLTGSMTATGDIIAGTISLEHHVHGEVQSGSSETAAPVA